MKEEKIKYLIYWQCPNCGNYSLTYDEDGGMFCVNCKMVI
jgi:transcription initiation factor TFIIIB Brf1 subunit/transcription initiation factor TFIIB